MNAVVSFFTGPWESNLNGAIDVVVVEKEDGSLGCTPFHVRFGKLPSLHSTEQWVVELEVNGEKVKVNMKLGAAGEAFFVHETSELVQRAYMTSPIASPRRSSSISPPPLALEAELGAELASRPNFASAAASSTTDQDGFDGPSFENYQLLSEGEADGDAEFSADDEEDGDEHAMRVLESGMERISEESAEPGWSWSWGWGTMPVRRKSSKAPTAPPTGLAEHEQGASGSDSMTKTELSTATLFDIHQSMLDTEDTSLERFHSAVDLATMANEGDSASVSNAGLSGDRGDGTLEDAGLAENQGITAERSAFDQRWARSANVVEHESMVRRVRPIATRPRTDSGVESASAVFPGQVPLLSLCGDIIRQDEQDQALARKVFDENLVTFEAFSENGPMILRDPRLLVLIHDRLYTWEVAAPYFVSAVAFARPLPHPPSDAASGSDQGAGLASRPETSVPSPQKELHVSHSSTWWGVWWRQQQPETSRSGSENAPHSRDEHQRRSAAVSSDGLHDGSAGSSGGGRSLRTPPPMLRESNPAAEAGAGEGDEQLPGYRKSLFPSSEQLQAMRLKPGMNRVDYKIDIRGERCVSAHIFLWSTRTQIVVTDVDGAITRSSGRSNLIPRPSRNWSHSGVAKLFSGIAGNGYQFIYLTSRPIGQASSTKDLLGSVTQENATLPPGPVLLSPDSLFQSVQGQRLTQLFKLSALRGINNLFPNTQCPYHAGFGSSSGDERAYRKAGIPSGRIFRVDPDGRLRSQNTTFDKTYENILSLVDEIFPPLVDEEISKPGGRDDFADVNFWKIPVPLIDSSDDEA